jgi:dUTP pyrophosphatase
MKIEIKLLTPTAQLPASMSEHSAGYDIYADIQNEVKLAPGQRVLIPTGFAISLPVGYEAQIRSRSGLAINYGVCVLNSPGTIDSDYRGEVKVILINHGDLELIIEPAMRIAQMVIHKHEKIEFVVVEALDETTRGEGGFGHTKNT